MFLYSKEEQISMTSIRLQKVELAHNKGQDTITTNWRSNQKTQKCKILQQIGSYLGIQQCTNQRRQWMESGILNKQETIQAKSNILWTMQLARNISTDDK